MPAQREPARSLYWRLMESLDSEPERRLLKTYCALYGSENGSDTPALIPQVYLHYDPYTRAQFDLRTGEVKRERMDFLLLLPNRARIVLEVDGQQHYATDTGRASPARYAEMVREDRKIRLRGYEVYRFGGSEIMHDDGPAMLTSFFDALLRAHELSR